MVYDNTIPRGTSAAQLGGLKFDIGVGTKQCRWALSDQRGRPRQAVVWPLDEPQIQSTSAKPFSAFQLFA